MKTAKQIIALVSMVCTATYVQAQGSLTPLGAPAPTMKTLEQIEPRTPISDDLVLYTVKTSGSYYLTANRGPIAIEAPDVTLDLNGFEISPISGSGAFGVIIYPGMDRATVLNGTIVGFGDGIRGLATGCLFKNLAVSDCSAYGISAGDVSRVLNCRVRNNAGGGIAAGIGSSLQGCMAGHNSGSCGISAGKGSSISDCTASLNTVTNAIYADQGSTIKNCAAYRNFSSGSDSFGIYASSNCVISDCTSSKNVGTGSGSYGIFGGVGSSIIGCSSYWNESSGIFAGDGSTVSGCTAAINQGDYGIYGGEGTTIVGCSANNNTGAGISSHGIRAGKGSSVIECIAAYNSNTNSPSTDLQGGGIYALPESTVKNCTVSRNKGDGIRVDGYTRVKGNLCSYNGANNIFGDSRDGAGIHSTSSDNRIESNTAIFNERNIAVDGGFNLIIRNSAILEGSPGSNYVISVNNKVGGIVIPPNSPAISGNSGGAGVGSTDPWANFGY